MAKKETPQYTVFIPASGVGAPIGEITAYTNKSLIKVGKKPAISYIIESYPKDTHFIISVGYFADQIKDFLRLMYADRDITFVPVDTYEGHGSSLAYTLLKAMPHLQLPFVYHASDTIAIGHIPPPERNWIGGYKGLASSNYASFRVLNGKVQSLHEKGMLDPDYLHIGLVGIKDFQKFWDITKRNHAKDPLNPALGDFHTLRSMVEGSVEFLVHEIREWHDVGNVESLAKAREEIADTFHILDKVGESIFLHDDSVVKFFYDERMVSERVARAKLLKGLVPKIEGSTKNFYRYKYVDGDLYADVANRTNFREFLEWSEAKLWKPVKEVSKKEFKQICYGFYYTKSLKRIEKFLEAHSLKDEAQVINGEKVPSLKDIFAAIDFDWLCDSKQTGFHGDFILDNIIKTKKGYCLLDWRQNFGGLLEAGDMYYDLGKLQHNLTVNHSIINDNLFSVVVKGKQVECDILRKNNLVECNAVLTDFLTKNGYDRKKVDVLTGIIWLNMSPLHHHPFDLFLFYFGKLKLWRTLNGN